MFWENTVFLYEIKIENIIEDLKKIFTTTLFFICFVFIPSADLKWGYCNNRTWFWLGVYRLYMWLADYNKAFKYWSFELVKGAIT